MSDLPHTQAKKKPGFARLLTLEIGGLVRGVGADPAEGTGSLDSGAAQSRGARKILRALSGGLHLARDRQEVLAPAGASVGGEADLHEVKLTRRSVTVP
jgi:hypothetical protein